MMKLYKKIDLENFLKIYRNFIKIVIKGCK